MPDWRVPSRSPWPRSSRSRSAISKPSSVDLMVSSRACGRLAQRLLVEQQAGRALRAAADAAAQLVQLREAEALGMLDDHDGGVGHVDADFDHRGGDEDLGLVALEAVHHLLPWRPADMRPWTSATWSPNTCLQLGEAILGRDDVELFALLDQRRHPEGLRALGDARLQPRDDAVVFGDREHGRIDRLPAARLFAQDARPPCRRNG